MDLAQLRALVRVAESGSLNKAADLARIAQPALSRQIGLLESELRTQLFIRHGRGMVLTSSGQKVLNQAKAILNEIENLKLDVHNNSGEIKGEAVIGVPPTLGEVITVPFMEVVKKKYPSLRVQFTPGFGGHLIEWLRRGDLDFAVLYDLKHYEDIECRPLRTEPLFAISSKISHPFKARAVSFAEFAKHPLVLPGVKHSTRAIVEKMASEAAISLNISIEVESIRTTKDLVLSGAGLALLPLYAVSAEIAAGKMMATAFVGSTVNWPSSTENYSMLSRVS